MRIRSITVVEDYDLSRLINQIVVTVNKATMKKPSFIVRKKTDNNGFVYFASDAEELINFLKEGYEIVAVFKKDI